MCSIKDYLGHIVLDVHKSLVNVMLQFKILEKFLHFGIAVNLFCLF